MKRSEVLEKLADMLEEQRKDLNNGSDYQDAEVILDYLENQVGMFPPFNADIYGDTWRFGGMGHEWEKE